MVLGKSNVSSLNDEASHLVRDTRKQTSLGKQLAICTCNPKGRNLVVCIDGTSNQFGQNNTNVTELYRLLDKDETQVTFYNSGIGTYARPSWRSLSYWKQAMDNTIDLAIAWNLESIVMSAYHWLSENYVKDDRIFLFGFSRGAYQVRALSAMIHKVGLIHKGNEDQIPFAYELYADPTTSQGVKPRGSSLARKFKETFSRKDVQVHFVGAWDTVSSVGVIRDKTLPGTTDGMQHVCFFRHALALDERRVKFLPEYARGGVAKNENEKKQGKDTPQATNPHTKEVWFAGTHSDVGGGNVENLNMDRGKPPLRWMSREARIAGLRLAEEGVKIGWETLGSFNESLTYFWLLLEYMPIPRLSYENANGTTISFHRGRKRQIQPGQTIHPSVVFSEHYAQAVSQIHQDRANNQTSSSQPNSNIDWSWVEMDLSDIAESIVRDFEGLTADPQPAAERLEKFSSIGDGIQALRDSENAVESLSLAWHNLRYDDSTQQVRELILTALKKMGECDEGAQEPRLKTSSGVTSIAISQNGKVVVSGSLDRYVRIWDPSGYPMIGCLEGHTGPVSSVAVSRDGTRIVSGSWDRTIIVWDVKTGGKVGTPFQGHNNRVTSVAFSPNETSLASASLDGTTVIWGAKGDQFGQVMRRFDLPGTSINSIAFSMNEEHVVMGSLDRKVQIWSIETGTAICPAFEGHTGSVTCVTVSPDRKHLASSAGDETIRVWDSETGSSQLFQGHTSSVTSVAFSPNGEHIVSGSLDRTVRIWELGSGKAVGSHFTGHTGSVTSVVFSPDGKYIISGGLDGSIKLWCAFPPQEHNEAIRSVAYSPDGQCVVAGSWNGAIRVWNAETGEAIGQPFRGDAGVNSVAYSPDGKRVVSGSMHRTIQVWNTETGEAIGEPFRGHKKTVFFVAYSPDGKHVVSGSLDKTIRVWNTETGEAVGEPFRGHKKHVLSVAYSPDGKRVVSGSGDGTIRVWNQETGEAMKEPFQGHEGYVWSVAYSPDGKHIVSGSDDGTIRVWNVETGAAIGKPLRGHAGTVRSVAYTADGRRIVSGSFDHTIRVWDAETGEAIGKPLEPLHGLIFSVAVLRDGKRVVSGSRDGSVDIWDFEDGDDQQSSSVVLRPHTFASVWSIDTKSPDNSSA